MLMRAPRESGSWFWDLDDVVEPGLESALRTAGRMSAVLQKHRLLEPDALEWNWFQLGKGGLGIHSRLDLVGRSLEEPQLPEALRSCRPAGHPQAEMGGILVLGSGTWFDAAGTPQREHRLVELMVSPDEIGPSAEISVHHDIWSPCDFRGEPHPVIHAANAPRLKSALEEIVALLGVEPEPGEPTYYGHAKGFELAAPDLVDGRGPDLTDTAVG
ncbi:MULTISPECIES: hypothetical protein [unclassified Streptomyces]|uniref:hypothetical protein n=1 Tax=unclassified Streptomyces TaxID=2593676 RepID=UPI00035F3A27|nr:MULTISPECIES: hypothetical protein [unclassified Streptomyces]MYQ76639.1 hypothetical protein [Streptomyces sp. SID4923]